MIQNFLPLTNNTEIVSPFEPVLRTTRSPITQNYLPYDPSPSGLTVEGSTIVYASPTATSFGPPTTVQNTNIYNTPETQNRLKQVELGQMLSSPLFIGGIVAAIALVVVISMKR
jgi:hypothetical protein